MALKRFGVVVCLVMAVLVTDAATASAQVAAPLFTPVAQAAPPGERGVIEQRLVRPNLAVFGPAEPVGDSTLTLRIALDLRPGETVIALLSRQRTPGTDRETWSGPLEGIDFGRATVVVDRANGLLTGTIRSPLGMFEVRPAGSGFHAVKRLDPGQLPPDGEPREVPVAARDASTPGPAYDSADRIDVLVVYTPAARAAAGGTAAIQNAIAVAVADTNQSYANSGVAQRIRLVHQSEIAYTENGDSGVDLDRLTGTSDGHMDSVHTLRNTYGADLVALINDTDDVCGIAWLMGTPSAGFAANGFSVTNVGYGCLTGGTFAHELGHNMGAHHDRAVVSGASATAYNFGYVAPTGAWRTTMAYSNACSGCARVQYWSNPGVTYPGSGLPMGIAAGNTNPAHNQRRLNETALTVANFRQEIPDAVPPGAATLISPAGSGASTSPTYTWNKVTSSTWYELFVQQDGGPVVIDSWHTDSVCGASTCSVTPSTALTAGTAYTWWIRTYNSHGYGPWSAGSSFSTQSATPPAATLISPSGSAPSRRPIYTWQKVASATWYELYVSRGSTQLVDVWYPSANVCGETICTAQPDGDLIDGDHSWWVRTWNSNGYGPWSSGATFGVGLPGAATLRSPTGTTSSVTPTFTWDPVGSSTWYYLWIAGPGGAVSQWYEAEDICNASACSVTSPASLAVGAHTWWVQTWNPFGYGPWSSPAEFVRSEDLLPPAATLVSPVGGTTVHSLTPVFTWNRVNTASWYYVWVSHPGGTTQEWFASSAVCGSTTCSTALSGALTAGSATWWVQTWNSSGYGPWSNGAAFTVGQPVLSAKLTWAANPADLDLHLRTPSINGSTYHVYYGARGSRTAAPFAELDVDDTSGFGPETISIHQSHTGTYRIFVHRYSGTGTLAGSGAKLELFLGSTLIGTYIAPSSGSGDYWLVCDVSNAATGARSCPNTIGTTALSTDGDAIAGVPATVKPSKLAAIKGGRK